LMRLNLPTTGGTVLRRYGVTKKVTSVY